MAEGCASNIKFSIKHTHHSSIFSVQKYFHKKSTASFQRQALPVQVSNSGTTTNACGAQHLHLFFRKFSPCLSLNNGKLWRFYSISAKLLSQTRSQPPDSQLEPFFFYVTTPLLLISGSPTTARPLNLSRGTFAYICVCYTTALLVTSVNQMTKKQTVTDVDKRYNLSVSLSPVYSLLYVSFAEAEKSQACNVLADDACCRRQFARVSDVTLTAACKSWDAGCLSGVWAAHFKSIVLSEIVFFHLLLLSHTLLCTNLCIIQIGI